jgi:mannose-6-phosphate isomerase-like protein (cupin superfamily)
MNPCAGRKIPALFAAKRQPGKMVRRKIFWPMSGYYAMLVNHSRPVELAAMSDQSIVNEFSHVKPGDTPWRTDGLRSFFLYRDLGIRESTGGRVVCQLVKANPDFPPEHGTGWHQHIADFHIVLMTKGWARFMYGDKEHLVAAGDCVHQQPGITHYLFDYSPDMEYLEITAPADFGTIDVAGPCPVPAPTAWAKAAE